MNLKICLAFAAWLSPALLLAQTHRGAGISGSLGPRIAVDYVREHWGPPDSVRLAVVTIWRGRTDWGLTRSDSEAALARRSADSARTRSRERGRSSGGTITPRAAAWTEYDSRSRTAFVLGQAFHAPRGDSTLVLLIDNIDRIAAEPNVTALVIPHQAVPDESRAPGLEVRRTAEATMALEAKWDAVLRSHATIGEFLGKRSP